MILLPLIPASPTHKNRQRRTKVHGMRPVGGKDRSEDVFVQYPVRVISVAVVSGRIFLLVFVELYKRISYYLSGASHRGLSIFNFRLFFFFFFGTRTHWFSTATHDFSQDVSQE